MFSKALTLMSVGLPLISAAPPAQPGFKLTWSDDFIGNMNSLPSTANWIVGTGTQYPGGAANWGTGEIETYTSSPANVKLTGNGSLAITPLRDASGKWTSGKIESVRSDFQAAAGGKMRIAASIAMPAVTGAAAVGYWPAFWTLGENFRPAHVNWPACGEFDIMESINGQNMVYGTMHCGIWGGGPCHETDGLSLNRTCPGAECAGNYHTYMIEVNRASKPETLTWYVDNMPYHTVKETDIPEANWVASVHHGHFILMNLAIGGAFPNKVSKAVTPNAQTVPGHPMMADWVAVWNSV